jgi:hypothetical protein
VTPLLKLDDGDGDDRGVLTFVIERIRRSSTEESQAFISLYEAAMVQSVTITRSDMALILKYVDKAIFTYHGKPGAELGKTFHNQRDRAKFRRCIRRLAEQLTAQLQEQKRQEIAFIRSLERTNTYRAARGLEPIMASPPPAMAFALRSICPLWPFC